MSKPQFALYVSPVEGKTFIRPGTAQILGGRRISVEAEVARGRQREEVQAEIAEKGPVRWSPDRVYGVPVAEFERYRREYDRALLSERSLRKRTEADWQAQCARDEKAQTEARAAAENAQKAAAARMTESPDAAPAAPATP